MHPVSCLLVDDLEENLIALEALLRRDGLVLHKARSGDEALEILLKHDVALALIDVQMPGMDGFELAEIMRGTERTRRVPIIFLTAGKADRQRTFRGYGAGAVDFLEKPIEVDILKTKADIFFELFRQRDELRAAAEENARLLHETRRAAEALREADRRKDEFLATLAHELRNPLAPIRASLAILKLAGSNEAASDHAREVIGRQVVHMVRLIDDLMDVARFNQGKITLKRESVELSAVIEHAIETSQSHIDKARHTLDVHLPGRPVLLDGDASRLAQVVSTLLTTAAKYTPPGGSIRLEVVAGDDEAIIRVTDNGSGISAEMLPKIFGIFTQLDGTIEHSQGGLGLGLAIVRKLVELHGGKVEAESPGVGLGSTFTVRLPLPVTADDMATPDGSP
jgi:signal transduction histidine kinase